MIQLLRNVYEYLKKENLHLHIFIFILCLYQFYYRYTTQNTIKYMHSVYNSKTFDASNVPNGLVIYKSGLPSSYNPFIKEDATMQYDFFVIGIWNTNNDVVHEIVIPRYAYNRFIVGYYVHTSQQEDNNENDSINTPNKLKQNNLYSV